MSLSTASKSNSNRIDAPRAKLLLARLKLEREKRRRARIAALTPSFRGACAAIQSIRTSDEFILSGPYETGKTFAALWLLDTLLREFPGARAAMLRKVHADMQGTVLETWKYIVSIRGLVEPFGGERPEWYDYPNGSRLYIGGIDKPGKTLSGERDFIYVNQAEQLDLEDWETLRSRSTGRAANAIDADGIPIGMLFGDCNPGPPNHWIPSRDSLRLLATTHRDNPTLYADDGELTERGKQTMAMLDTLTGIRRARGKDGLWAGAEGLVLDQWDDGSPDGNVTQDADYEPGAGDVYWGVDDGYSGEKDPKTGYFTPTSHPRVFLFFQVRSDGTVCLFDESYQCGLLDEQHLNIVLPNSSDPDFGENERRFASYPRPEYVGIDSSAAKLKRAIWNRGITYRNGTSNVEESIKQMQSFIGKDPNGVRRLIVHPRCRHFRAEAASYRRDPTTGKPIKENDNGMDACRYFLHQLRFE